MALAHHHTVQNVIGHPATPRGIALGRIKTNGPVRTPSKKDIEACRHIVKEVMNLQLQVHDLTAQLALKSGMNETDALPALERIEAFGRMAQTYAALSAKALENYRAAVEGVSRAAWEEFTKMAAEAPTRRAELEGIIRQLQGGQGAALEAEKL
ncbi:unnamed protein product [Caenorhabditis brenneri]